MLAKLSHYTVGHIEIALRVPDIKGGWRLWSTVPMQATNYVKAYFWIQGSSRVYMQTCAVDDRLLPYTYMYEVSCARARVPLLHMHIEVTVNGRDHDCQQKYTYCLWRLQALPAVYWSQYFANLRQIHCTYKSLRCFNIWQTFVDDNDHDNTLPLVHARRELNLRSHITIWGGGSWRHAHILPILVFYTLYLFGISPLIYTQESFGGDQGL